MATYETVPEVGPEESSTESAEPEAVGAHTPVSYKIPVSRQSTTTGNGGEDDGGGEGGDGGEGFGFDFGPLSFSIETGEEGGEESEFEASEGAEEFSESFLAEAA